MHAQPDEKPSISRASSFLTPAQETEMRRMDLNGDGIIDNKEARAIARSTAKLRASKSKYLKGLIVTVALLVLSWVGNAGLTVAVVTLSKDVKVEGGSFKTKGGDSISTVSQKHVYEVTLLSKPRPQLHEERANGKSYTSTVVLAEVTCSTVMDAISSIEKGNDGSLVKMAVGDGKFWEPRASAAYYQLHDDSFGIEQVYLDDKRDVSYDVTCEMSKADCENAPGTLCEAVASQQATLDGAFDGDFPARRRLAGFGTACKERYCLRIGCADDDDPLTCSITMLPTPPPPPPSPQPPPRCQHDCIKGGSGGGGSGTDPAHDGPGSIPGSGTDRGGDGNTK